MLFRRPWASFPGTSSDTLSSGAGSFVVGPNAVASVQQVNALFFTGLFWHGSFRLPRRRVQYFVLAVRVVVLFAGGGVGFCIAVLCEAPPSPYLCVLWSVWGDPHKCVMLSTAVFLQSLRCLNRVTGLKCRAGWRCFLSLWVRRRSCRGLP